MSIEIQNNKLVSGFPTGNKAWLAKITGTHEKFGLNREFLNGTRRGKSIDEIEEGDIIELVEFSHSGKNRTRDYFIVKDNEGTFELEKQDMAAADVQEMMKNQSSVEKKRKNIMEKLKTASADQLEQIENILK